jgi:DNA-binding MarR family transcriptional regulator
MPRRLSLSPLQRDIIVMLEEAGAETIGTVIATVKPVDQDEFARSVSGLIRLGLIRRNETECADGKRRTDLVLTEQGKDALTK